MDLEQFWQIIETSRQRLGPEPPEETDPQYEDLAKLLAELSPEELVSFRDHFQDRMNEAGGQKLRDAVSFLQHDYSISGFTDRRAWLIAQGRRAFETVVADPDALADVPVYPMAGIFRYECYHDLMSRTYEDMTGDKLPAYAGSQPDEPGNIPDPMRGLNELTRRFPRIAAARDPRDETWRVRSMSLDRFWEIIETARRGPDLAVRDVDEHYQVLADLLSELPPEEIVCFRDLFNDRKIAAYDWDLWAAIYFMDDGCSDDGFADFCDWLISMGRRVYEDALADPDSLAGPFQDPEVGELYFYEGFGSIAYDVYEKLTGSEIPSDPRLYPFDPTGVKFDGDDWDALARRFPRIAAVREARDRKSAST